MKQPLPNFLDPKRGFGARGEGTLTSKLIVMKNINKELIKYQSYILDVYEKVKIANRSDYPGLEPEPDYPDYPGNLNQTKDYEYGENEENFDEAEYKEEGNNEDTEVSFSIGCYYEIGCGEFPSHIITKIILTLWHRQQWSFDI